MKLANLFVLAAILLAGCSDSGSRAEAPTPVAPLAAAEVPVGTGFDFYVLSLSWSPQYCASKGKDADPQQCRASKPINFIVHGLWPQNERGYPEYCSTNEEPTREELRSVFDLTPSAGLLRHEWKKHGTCSGLSPSDYFKAMRAAREAVTIPAQLTTSKAPDCAFCKSN